MIDSQDKQRLIAISEQAGDWRQDMEREIRALKVNTDHPAHLYRAAIELYFSCLWKSGEARMQCDADDPDLCTSSRCQERQREASSAAEDARLALGALVVAQ